MSYAPIQSESTLNAPTPTRNHYSIASNSVLRKAASGNRKRARVNSYRNSRERSQPIIVHSHLCWDWVWQRPQQFVSRLSHNHKVLFVETIAPDSGLASPLARFRQLEDFPNVTVLRLQFPQWSWGDGAYVDRERRRLVQEFLGSPAVQGFEEPIQWFYDPMAVTAFAGEMGEVLTVYDCMDELSKFRGAPPEIIDREKELLARADVVFTGGRRLFESKSRFNDNCHFYGCGVDVNHFGQARSARTVVPPELAALPQPVLGYFGVIDERMDYELLAELARRKPQWSIALIGPTTKIDPNSLPQAANLHWLGQRSYAQLPACCKAFDLCLMPFAMNEATEFINPTKALEYMATGREIISTPVPDVVQNFGSVIRIAGTADEFVAMCERALDQPDAEAIARGLKLARQHSWDSIVAHLENHLQEALANKGQRVNA